MGDSADKKLFFDLAEYKDNTIEYLPEEVWTDLNSLKLWQPVKNAVVINDMVIADEEKKKIEQAQRKREAQRKAANATKKGTYFTFVPNEMYNDGNSADDYDADVTSKDLDQKGHWDFNNNIAINDSYLQDIAIQVEKVRAERKKAAEEKLNEPDAENPDEGNTNANANANANNAYYNYNNCYQS